REAVADADQDPRPEHHRAQRDPEAERLRRKPRDPPRPQDRAGQERGAAVPEPGERGRDRAAREQPPGAPRAPPGVQRRDHLGGGDPARKGEPLLLNEPPPERQRREDAEGAERQAPPGDDPPGGRPTHELERRDGGEEPRRR